MRTFIDALLERLRGLGYEVVSCLVDSGDTAEDVAARLLDARASRLTAGSRNLFTYIQIAVPAPSAARGSNCIAKRELVFATHAR